MNAAFRHLSVRLWLTAFTGALACITILPWWQQTLGLAGLAIPAVVIMAACFAGVGWVMNRIGLVFLNRHVNEATVWERAGMISEAETTFGKAMAAFDSFWLSPVLRRGKFQWFSGLVARFYLGQHSDSAFVRMMISTHLKSFPGDNAVAEPWLEKLLVYESHLPQENEAAARVSASLAEHRRVQRLLMHYYMANGRTDFDALQTYRRVWNDETPLAKDTLLGLARLLRNGYILNHWALQVYMLAFDNGDQQAVEGIFAAVKWLPATEESRPLLKDAKKVIAGLDRHDPGSLDPNFKPVQQRPVPDDKSRLRHDPGPEFKRALIRIFTSAWAKGAQWAKWFTGTFRNKRLRRALPGGVVVVALVVAAMVGRHFFSRPNEDPITAKTVVAEKISITDPFTIQVAAYLKPEDAQRFVDQLVKNGLDAFWTQARSAKRTWYQVKVSHFADRNGAQRYGQELKSNGLIDDFYVANYEHESRNSQLK